MLGRINRICRIRNIIKIISFFLFFAAMLLKTWVSTHDVLELTSLAQFLATFVSTLLV